MEYYKQEIKEVLENLVGEDERHEVAQSLHEDDDLISLGLV